MQTKEKIFDILVILLVIFTFLNITLLILIFDRLTTDNQVKVHKQALSEFFANNEFTGTIQE